MEHLDRTRVQYLSHSKVSSILRCPRCYHRQYLLDVEPDSTALRLAVLFHEAASLLYNSPVGATPAQLFERLNTRDLEADEKASLTNAIILLCEHRWSGFEVVSVETPFFWDLARDLPPVIGIADLVLRKGETVTVVVDHKTATSFADQDHGQLVLYAGHARDRLNASDVDAYYDEYRFVPNLATIRKPAFRRTAAEVGENSLSPLIARYRNAWDEMRRCAGKAAPRPSAECWYCKK